MLTTARSQPWIVTCRPTSGVRLLCFPYAGGGPSMVRGWAQYLSPEIELCAAQLPGREARMKELPIGNLRRLVAELADVLEPSLDRPVALFGHSIGGLIAFELAREIRRRYAIEPVHLFVSGCPAPQIRDNDPLFDLPEDEFLDHMRRFNGTPREVLEHPEIMQLVLPALRADFSLRDTYVYVEEPPLHCAISVFGGLEDIRVGTEELEKWRAHTSESFQMCLFQGGHFFLRTAQAAVVESVTRTLHRYGR